MAYRVGILCCDELGDGLDVPHESYASLFPAMLGAGFDCAVWRCHAGEFPESPESCGAWLVTGSRASAFDDESWIADTIGFVRRASEAGSRLVGLCFGHQLINLALGGRVECAPAGWGLGAYEVDVTGDGVPRPSDRGLRLYAVHQDQVVAPAPGQVVVAGSPFCPNYATVSPRILTVQGHPEFDEAFYRAVLDRVRARVGDEAVYRALATLDREHDMAAMRECIRRFIRDPAR